MASIQVRALGMVFVLFSALGFADSRLINGTPVPAGTWQNVISIQSSGAGCTATVVGPRVIITAAHCATDGATATFTVGTTKYSAKMTRSPLYATKDHDVAIGVTTSDIAGITPATIGGTASSGLGITLFGFGCTQPGGGGGNDGVLRMGDTVVTGFDNLDMVSKKAGGAALCFGDSGGPAFVQTGGSWVLVGVNSKGNIVDTNYDLRLDIDESKTFLTTSATTNGVDICGINKNCGEPPPPPPKPTCTLTATPSQIKLGESLSLAWVTQGQVDTASLDGEAINLPSGQKTVQPAAVGTFTPRVTINGPGGTNTCETTYNVTNLPPPPPDKPTCTLTAIPDTVQLGESLTLQMTTTGNVTSATIDGVAVAFPMGQKIVTPPSLGSFTANGVAVGPAGQGTCLAGYRVVNGPPPPPPDTPNFAVVGAYCGDNVVAESGVSRVCLAVVKHDTSLDGLLMNQVLLVTYRDATKEVLPIILRKAKTSDRDGLQQETITFYANSAIPAGNYMVLDTRTATLTKQAQPNGDVPVSIQGRTAKGMFFLVDALTPNG